MSFSGQIFLGFLLLTTVVGCSGSQGKMAAVVNGQIITEQEVQERLSRLSAQARQSIGNDPKRLLEEIVTETILLQEARRRGLERDAEVRVLLKDAKRQVLIGRFLEIVRDNAAVEVTPEEVSQFYETNRARFVQPESFRASHILVADEATAKKALERLKSGEEFAQVAQALSIDMTAVRGGDVGFFSAGQLVPEFEAVCQKLKPGERSGIVKTSLGYHIILLTQHQVERTLPLEEVEEAIRGQLAMQKKQDSLEESVQQLRQKAQIQRKEIYPSSPSTAPDPTSSGPSNPSS